MKYLIVKCEELGDQFECDANRTPITICNDWKKWASTNKVNYLFEVYAFDGKEFSLIKHYEEAMEKGMALVCFNEEADPYHDNNFTVIKKYKNLTRDENIPDEVWDLVFSASGGYDETDDSKESCGYFTWYSSNGNFYVYGEYYDNHYTFGY